MALTDALPGPARDWRALPLPELVALLAGCRPAREDVVGAALTDALARGLLIDVDRPVAGRHGVRRERLLRPGPAAADRMPDVLLPVRAAHAVAPPTPDAAGGTGVRVGDWVAALHRILPGNGYVAGVVLPALAARGLAARVPRRFLPGGRWLLTPDGESARRAALADLSHRVQQADLPGARVVLPPHHAPPVTTARPGRRAP